jgi:ABC-type multidrug transport system fused ATPase/permease subunit
LFEDFALTVRRGECCRISGASGSGKSTLVRLLIRLHEPDRGRVLIDGIDVREYSLDSLRRQVSYLSQEASLLSISVADNIRLGSPDAGPEEIRDAAKRAGAHEFIQAARHGYDSLLGERGLSVSGGERQRLILARAIVRDPAILVLDEPMNHLDPPSSRAVAELIADRKRRRRTTVLISHDELPSDRTIRIDGHIHG